MKTSLPLFADGPHAFPQSIPSGQFSDYPHGGICTGLSSRDYFAAKALQGELAAQTNSCDYGEPEEMKDLAGWCYQMADFMIAESKPRS